MPNSCCVPGCCSNYKDGEQYVPAFTFPTAQDRKELWKRKIPRDITVTKNTVVCIKHFQDRFLIKETRATRPDGKLYILFM